MKYIRRFGFFCISIFLSFSAAAVEGVGNLKVLIVQQGKLVNIEKLYNNIDRVRLSKKPFEIHYSADDLGVCVSTQRTVFAKAKQGVDTVADFSSCLFLYKAFGMSADGGELIADMDGANWLNKSHGARKGKDGRFIYSVERFSGKETGNLELSKVAKPMYLLFWDDLNKNKVVDFRETARVELVFD